MTRYLVDDLNPTGYAQVVEELSSAGVVQRQYTYGLQRISQNQVVSNSWTPSFYGYDGFGTVRQLTNSAGVITDTYDYDAFGNKVNSTGSTPNNYLYRGEQFDSDLGLYYLRARYYNPTTGRFLSRDPESGDYRDPATLHKYMYAGNDPVNGDDPSGRSTDVLKNPGGGETAEYVGLALLATATVVEIQHVFHRNAGTLTCRYIGEVEAEPYDRKHKLCFYVCDDFSIFTTVGALDEQCPDTEYK